MHCHQRVTLRSIFDVHRHSTRRVLSMIQKSFSTGMSRTSLNAIARSSDGQCIPFMIRISCRSVMTRTRLAAATAAGRSRCRKPRCGWPRPRWRTATRPCPHSAANSGSPPLVTLPAPTCSSSGHPTPPRRGPGRKAHRISWSTGFRSRLTLLARLPEGLSRCRLGFGTTEMQPRRPRRCATTVRQMRRLRPPTPRWVPTRWGGLRRRRRAASRST